MIKCDTHTYTYIELIIVTICFIIVIIRFIMILYDNFWYSMMQTFLE